MADLLSADEEALLLEQLAASARDDAARYAADVDRLVRLERLSLRTGHTERGLEMELAGTLRIGQQAAAIRLSDARRLTEALPLTLEALRTGALLLPQARLVMDETRHCTEQVALDAERRVLAGLDREQLAGWTARRLRSRLRAAVLVAEAELDPEHTVERERSARDSRRVSVRPEPDGMASLWALLPAEQARVFATGFDLLAARQLQADRTDGVVRTADQRRADLLAVLPALALHALDGTAPPATSAHPSVVVHVHVPMATALGLSDEPGDLEGYGPISAGTVRLLLPDARLRRVLVDAQTGQPLHVEGRTTAPASRRAARRAGGTRVVAAAAQEQVRHDPERSAEAAAPHSAADHSAADHSAAADPAAPPATQRVLREALLGMLDERPFLLDETPEPQYRPSAPLARLVHLRDQHCWAPGCSQQVRPDDLDHRVPWPLGPTSAGNLAPLTRRCHRAKTTSWSLCKQRDGSHLWSSPVGRQYVVPPPWRPPPVPRLPARAAAPPVHVAQPEADVPGGLTDQLDEQLTSTDVPSLPPAPAVTPASAVVPAPGRSIADAPAPF